MKRVRQLAAVLGLVACGLFAAVAPVAAAGSSTHANASPIHEHLSNTGSSAASWSQHDTAVYVVSTLNLLHSHNGQSMTDQFTHKMNVTHYDVYADQSVTNLFFIYLRRDDGSIAGVFAYTMGWSRPRLVFLGSTTKVRNHSPNRIALAYRTDAKVLIGSFTSTLPS